MRIVGYQTKPSEVNLTNRLQDREERILSVEGKVKKI